jgi:membrane protease YdiL (CAAX protease family)
MLVFAVTMTYALLMPGWVNNAARAGFLLALATLWRVAPRCSRLIRFRPAFFAYFTAVLSQSLGFYLGDWGLRFLGFTTQTPAGVAVAKALQASLIVIGILVTARLFKQDVSSLYLRKGRLLFGITVGGLAAAVCIVLSLAQPDIRAFGLSKLVPLIPWVVLFVLTNAFMEELYFRGLFLGRYEPLMGKWLAILSTALAFTFAHVQVNYTQGWPAFFAVLLLLSVAWGWLMQKTGSLWSSMLFHAGADVFIILAVFKSFGAI